MRSGGQLLVECLQKMGASTCYGVPGESYLAVLDALHDTKGALDFVMCRHEGGAGFMAAAHGKLTGRPGIAFVTRGPGATNASIGVHTAMQDSAPMLLFVGQVGTDMKGREAFQELDYRAVFGSMAKWVVEIDHVRRIPEILARAWKTALSGRPGPVVIALPEDVLTQQTEALSLIKIPQFAAPCPDPNAVQTAHAMLKASRRPLILYGGCNWNSTGSQALQTFAERSDIPVICAFRYQDQYDNRSPTFCGEAGVGMIPSVRALLEEADTVLAINNRFGENSTEGYSLLRVPDPKQKLVHVHSADAEIGKVYQPDLGIVSDPNRFAEALLDQGPVTRDRSKWCRAARHAFETGFNLPDLPSPVDMGKVTAHLRDVLPDDVIVTNGAGNFTVWPNKFIEYGPKARLLAPQSGAMGYGVPAAIAAKITHPDRMVLCFAGDGDFQMSSQELATAAQAKAHPIILVLNNGIYGTIRAHQERHYPKRVSGTTMTGNPDFAKLAQAYGFHGERVETTAEFSDAFARACASSTGAVLDLVISPEAVTPRTTLSQMRDTALS